MNDKILVAYASRTGTTAGIAEAIGKTLSANGAVVDVLSMSEVKDLAPYRAVVIGSAIQKSKWLPEAAAFVQAHRAALSQKPLAMFTVCITLAMKNGQNYRPTVAEWVQPVRSQLKPVSEGFFAGMLNFDKLPFNMDTLMFRLTVLFGVFPRGDQRDWNAIRVWTESLLPLLI